MLIELFGRNFRSFKDEFSLSLIASDIDRDNPRGIIEVPLEGEDEPLRLLRSAAIYGPNASGKSTVLLAAAALEYLLGTSGGTPSDEPIAPYKPFLFDDDSSNQPVMLGLKAVIDRRVYEYVVEFNKKEFLKERLIEITLDKEELLFERDGQNVSGAWKGRKQFELLSESFRPNALLLSLADTVAPSLASGLAVGFRRLLRLYDHTSDWRSQSDERYVARRAHEDRDHFGQWLTECLQGADVGVVGHDVEEVHAAERGDRPRPPNFRLSLLHSTSSHMPVPIGYHRESEGTRRVAELAPFLYDLTHGGEAGANAFFIDEIGASMHPDLLQALIRRFNCEASPDSVKGQLIFATHETRILDAEAKDAILRRDQIYLTEKDSSGASRLYSVADFKERNNLNLRRRYLQGRYGALPSVGHFGE